jgi:hypothetical protein
VWRYHTRPHEPSSRLIVGSIDVVGRETVVSVCVVGVSIRNASRPDFVQDMLPHTSVAAATLAECVIELEGVLPVPPEFEDGYRAWTESVELGQAGFFTMPVAEILTIAEQASTG